MNDHAPDRRWARKALRRARRDHPRRWLPVGLLGLSLGVAGFGVIQAYQAQRSHQATAEALLYDYGVFAAGSFRQAWGSFVMGTLGATLDGARNAALRQATTEQCLNTLLVHAAASGGGEPATGVARPAATAAEGESCGCGYEPMVGPAAWAFHVTLDGGEARGLYQGRVPAPAVRDRAVADLVRFARAEVGLADRMLRWVDVGEAEPRLFAFTALRAFSEDTVVYGVEADPERLVATFEHAVEHADLLPPALTHGKASRELLAVQVVRGDGMPVYESAPGTPMELAGEESIPAAVGGGTIRASVLPEAADELIIGGLPTNRVPLLLTVFGLSALLALLAVWQLRKEDAFARQRQDFVAGVSHELRTPLAQIRLFVETLQLGRTRTDGEREWALGNIDRETLRLTRLVENILHFNRAERGRLADLEREPTDLGAEARSVVDGFKPLLRPHQAELEVEVDDNLVAEVHRDSFRQVLLNLLDNAVKYGPTGQTIRIAGEADGDVARLTVSDEGPGVPPEERRSVWEPFRRGEDAVGSVATGSGIGLSVVREIVHVHDGRVRVEDAGRGRRGGSAQAGSPGARFVVELPLLRTVRPGQLRETAPAAASSGDVGESAAGVA